MSLQERCEGRKLSFKQGHEKGLLRTMSSILSIVCLLVASSSSLYAGQHWIGTRAASPMGISPKLSEELARSIRLTLSNEFGIQPLTISSAHLALHHVGYRAMQTPST